MVRIAGIKIETDLKGNPKKATIDLKKHHKIAQILEELGAIDGPVKKMTDAESTKGCITGGELIKRVHQRIDKWEERKK
jgi:hypothetical protein